MTSGADGVYDCGSVPAGELVVLCAEDNHAMSKRKVTLEADVGPGTIEEKGPADVALPQPLSATRTSSRWCWTRTPGLFVACISTTARRVPSGKTTRSR